MKSFRIFILLLTVAFNLTAANNADSVYTHQSVGLVLSGGGAKGIAHIGVIKALEDNNIPIDYITGTSMGAIVGSLYACGYTTDEMMTLIKSDEFAHWSTGTIDKQLTYYFLQEEQLPTLLKLNLGDTESTRWKNVLPSSLINPLPMNFAFMELYAPFTAQCNGNFDNLFVPFRCVSSDVTNKRKIVNKSGSLGDAVRASMSFPLAFHPIERNGALLYDGGIYDNFPVDVMRDNFAPQIMIGVDVSSSETVDPSENIISQLETMIIQHSDHELPPQDGIKLRVQLNEFGLLEFNKAQQIYDIGYKTAMSMMDSLKSRVSSRIPAEARNLRRKVFKSQTPYLLFDTVTVSGGTPSQNDYVYSLFSKSNSDTFDIEFARNAFYKAITPGKFKNLEPTTSFNDTTKLFALHLQSTLKNKYSIGIGGYLTTSSNSFLFLSGGYKTLSFNSLDLNLNTWIGQSYLAAEANAHIRLLRNAPSGIQAKAVISRQKYFRTDRMFFQTSVPTFAITNEYFGRIAYDFALGKRGKADISIGYGHQDNKFNSFSTERYEEFDQMWQNLAQIRGSYEYNTLNSTTTPTAGAHFQIVAMGVTGHTSIKSIEGQYTRENRSWGQIELTANKFFDFSQKFSLGVNMNLLGSTRKLLPTYDASVIDAPAYTPFASYANIITPEFRANSYAAVGIMPIWKISSIVQLRGRSDLFIPMRQICCLPDGSAAYGDWFSNAHLFSQLELVLSFPFANVTAYGHYADATNNRWNFGISLGLFLKAPRFLH